MIQMANVNVEPEPENAQVKKVQILMIWEEKCLQ